MLPANVVCQFPNHGVVAVGLQAHDTKGGGNDHTCLLVVRGGDALESREAGDGILSKGGLLVDHTADCAPDHTGRALIMEGTLARVGVHGLVAELSILGLISGHYRMIMITLMEKRQNEG